MCCCVLEQIHSFSCLRLCCVVLWVGLSMYGAIGGVEVSGSVSYLWEMEVHSCYLVIYYFIYII